jgi:hypothetical protein
VALNHIPFIVSSVDNANITFVPFHFLHYNGVNDSSSLQPRVLDKTHLFFINYPVFQTTVINHFCKTCDRCYVDC